MPNSCTVSPSRSAGGDNFDVSSTAQPRVRGDAREGGDTRDGGGATAAAVAPAPCGARRRRLFLPSAAGSAFADALDSGRRRDGGQQQRARGDASSGGGSRCTGGGRHRGRRVLRRGVQLKGARELPIRRRAEERQGEAEGGACGLQGLDNSVRPAADDAGRAHHSAEADPDGDRLPARAAVGPHQGGADARAAAKGAAGGGRGGRGGERQRDTGQPGVPVPGADDRPRLPDRRAKPRTRAQLEAPRGRARLVAETKRGGQRRSVPLEGAHPHPSPPRCAPATPLSTPAPSALPPSTLPPSRFLRPTLSRGLVVRRCDS